MTHPHIALALAATLTCSGCNGAASLAVTRQPPPKAPMPSAAGAFETGAYRNLFTEWNPQISASQIQDKLSVYWNSLFGTDPERRIYYPAGANANGVLAYIEDINNSDIRSEGMSYGMMIAVQMNRKTEFDALWNWRRATCSTRTVRVPVTFSGNAGLPAASAMPSLLQMARSTSSPRCSSRRIVGAPAAASMTM